MPLKTPDHGPLFVENFLSEFWLWMLMTDLRIEVCDSKTFEQSRNYFKNPDSRAVFSVAPHSSHIDALLTRQTIAELFPNQLPFLLYLAAQDNWDKWIKRKFAETALGEFILFDRPQDNQDDSKAQLKYLSDRLTGNEEVCPGSLVVFPHGTREAGASIHRLPVVLGNQNKIPIVTFKLHGTENILPKVPKDQQRSQILRKIGQRLLGDEKNRHHVSVEFTDFIPGDETPPRRKARFLKGQE